MNNFPSNKVLGYSILAVLIYLSIDFYYKGQRDFFQLKFDWNTLLEVESFVDVTLDSISYDFVKIKFKDLNNTLPSNFNNTFNTDNTFEINNKYYFKCTSITTHNNQVIFKGVFWINMIPEIQNGTIKISTVELELKQLGTKTVCFVGDSQITWREGKYTRKNIAKKIKDIKFVGHHNDVFGYPYDAILLNNTDLVLSNKDSISIANTYIVYLGAHEEGVANTKSNMISIVETLVERKSHVILIIPPNYLPPYKQKTNKELDKFKDFFANNPNIKILDLQNEFANTQDYLLEDGIHLNDYGHDMLVNFLIEQLNKAD